MRVNQVKYNAMMAEVATIFREKGSHAPCVLRLASSGLHDPEKFGVNWCARGTVPTDEALKVAREIKEASEIANLLNLLLIEVDYLNVRKFESKEAHREFCDDVRHELKTRSPRSLRTLRELLKD